MSHVERFGALLVYDVSVQVSNACPYSHVKLTTAVQLVHVILSALHGSTIAALAARACRDWRPSVCGIAADDAVREALATVMGRQRRGGGCLGGCPARGGQAIAGPADRPVRLLQDQC